ncbi:ARF/SAR superfamily protein [Cavenderia fasciculata]|uniref:ARF/SAR superfamily protein n=1 Tax=Cavenderia fasciculata TaxID=261658 RepID=F4Q883_CACFS|nr:ARF/SAR superfamily protein [Cavenderia fasciculata]EGG15983.1 ARF/SAR superfamily protein [Cavenderia fasciculata]|eukprot:XP_004352308.1 ARF/SAR superfamily protein [Cavenderia fasciculata]
MTLTTTQIWFLLHFSKNKQEENLQSVIGGESSATSSSCQIVKNNNHHHLKENIIIGTNNNNFSSNNSNNSNRSNQKYIIYEEELDGASTPKYIVTKNNHNNNNNQNTRYNRKMNDFTESFSNNLNVYNNNNNDITTTTTTTTSTTTNHQNDEYIDININNSNNINNSSNNINNISPTTSNSSSSYYINSNSPILSYPIEDLIPSPQVVNNNNNNNNTFTTTTSVSSSSGNSIDGEQIVSSNSTSKSSSPKSGRRKQHHHKYRIKNNSYLNNPAFKDRIIGDRETHEPINFLEIPMEMINYIFLSVGALHISSLLRVNRFCFKTGMNEALWTIFAQNDFRLPASETPTLIKLNRGSRSMYANLYFKRKNSIVAPPSPNPLIKWVLRPIKRLPSIFSRKEYKALMYGLDGVGKTTMLYKFARGENVRTLHTSGYNVEVVEYKSCDFICWDIGYEQAVVPVWHHYLQDTQAIIFIIDSADRQRLRKVREELWRMVTDRNVAKIVSNFKDNTTDPHNRVKVLIYANKQDLPSSMSTLEITLALSLFNLPKHVQWLVQACSATSEEGDGLYEGLDWLSSQFDFDS